MSSFNHKKIKALIAEQYQGIGRDKFTQAKLWPLVVAVTRGLTKPLYCAPWVRDMSSISAYTKPIHYTHSLSDPESVGYTPEQVNFYNNYELNMSAFLDIFVGICNEVSPFDIEKSEAMSRDIWLNRQAMVYPKAIALKAVAGTVLPSVMQSIGHYPIEHKDSVSLTENEAQEMTVAVARMMQLCTDLVKEYSS